MTTGGQETGALARWPGCCSGSGAPRLSSRLAPADVYVAGLGEPSTLPGAPPAPLVLVPAMALYKKHGRPASAKAKAPPPPHATRLHSTTPPPPPLRSSPVAGRTGRGAASVFILRIPVRDPANPSLLCFTYSPPCRVCAARDDIVDGRGNLPKWTRFGLVSPSSTGRRSRSVS